MEQNITVGAVDNPGGPGMERLKCSSAGLCHLRTTVRAVGLAKQKVFCLSTSLSLSLALSRPSASTVQRCETMPRLFVCLLA